MNEYKFLGDTITLTGISARGRRKIRKHGPEWKVLAETDHVLFSSDYSALWLYISPKDSSHDSPENCWMRAEGDVDFKLSK